MDDLDKFCKWFLLNMPVVGAVPFENAVTKIEDVTSVLMYRKDNFQVQMFIVPPHYIIPEHTHPNVDSIEVYMGGNIRFSHCGSFVNPEPDIQKDNTNLGCSKARGKTIRVKPNDLHGGIFGEGGGVFLSVQKWLNDVKPHCVAADYNGVVMGEDHLAKVVHGSPVLKQKLDNADAAHKEF